MVTVELATHFAVASGYTGVQVLVHSDNEGVNGALKAGCSRNPQQNRILQHIVNIFAASGIWITTCYIASADNPADGPSRGILPPVCVKSPITFALPKHLSSFLLVR